MRACHTADRSKNSRGGSRKGEPFRTTICNKGPSIRRVIMNRQSKKNRRRSRRALSILMVFAMLFTLTPAAGFAAENTAS